MSDFVMAAVQLDSQEDDGENWRQAESFCWEAKGRGADFIALPEDLLYDGSDTTRRHDKELWLPRMRELAVKLGLPVLFGSVREPFDERLAHNVSYLVGSDGVVLARYAKIHLFDVDIPGGPKYLETSYVQAGDEIVSCDVPGLGLVGLSICYDLRFPELYRSLFQRGARSLFVPSSFAMETGRDHWLTLLKARAIENQCFVIAPNQCGQKTSMKKYGRSAIIDPWGTVLALAPDRPGVITASLDFEAQVLLRKRLPVQSHIRFPANTCPSDSVAADRSQSGAQS